MKYTNISAFVRSVLLLFSSFDAHWETGINASVRYQDPENWYRKDLCEESKDNRLCFSNTEDIQLCHLSKATSSSFMPSHIKSLKQVTGSSYPIASTCLESIPLKLTSLVKASSTTEKSGSDISDSESCNSYSELHNCSIPEDSNFPVQNQEKNVSSSPAFPEQCLLTKQMNQLQNRFMATNKFQFKVSLMGRNNFQSSSLGKKNNECFHVMRKSFATKVEAMPVTIKQPCTVIQKPIVKQSINDKKPKMETTTMVKFIHQASLNQDNFEIRQKHLLAYWGIPPKQTEPLRKNIPKSPSLNPAIRTAIQDTELSRPLTPDQVVEKSECHLRKKNIQHKWVLELQTEKSTDVSIPGPSRKIRMKNETEVKNIINLPFNEKTKYCLEFHIKKKIIKETWGIPPKETEPLKKSTHFASHFQEKLTANCFTYRKKETSTIVHARSYECLNFPYVHFASDARPSIMSEARKIPKNVFVRSLTSEEINKLIYHTTVKSLQVRLGTLPAMVQVSFKAVYFNLKRPLTKLIHYGNKLKRAKDLYLPFIDQDALHLIDFNVKHKYLVFLWKLPTVYSESMKMMIPNAPWTLTRIQPSGAVTNITDNETSFSSANMQDKCITLKKSLYRQALIIPQAWNSFSPPALQSDISENILEADLEVIPAVNNSPSNLRQNIEKDVKWSILQQQCNICGINAEQQSVSAKSQMNNHPEESFYQKVSTSASRAHRGHDRKGKHSNKTKRIFSYPVASITRTSIYLELENKKEKLNVHLNKKMKRNLELPLAGSPEFCNIDKAAERKKKITLDQNHDTHSNSHGKTEEGKPFCYVCMSSNKSDSTHKTVYWTLPKSVMEKNGYKAPQVIKIENKYNSKRSSHK